MKRDKHSIFFYLIWTIVISSFLGFLTYIIIGCIVQNSDQLIKEDSEYLYYKTYTLYNNDSIIHKYHKPITYEGIIIKKCSHFRGVPGKGGHRVYETTIEYNNEERFTETGWSYYEKHNIGDKVNIYVTFYPYKVVKLIKN